ncbi:hypothetical protein ALO75_200067 [Pseudomonas syringae pv. coryli]|uniref:Uncharacterized protein n=1 Tax=Pseudomonas syringae pv. coryli TaxID=317659 RepID=A0A0P9MHD1_9PSED|nr:hypothetical protein ALO75_200067 [Pseudomonas syringae pv. coryli]
MMADKRTQGVVERLSTMITASTNAPSARFTGAPKSGALKPPPRSVTPTLIRLTPINVMTIPVTSGVMTLRSWLMQRLSAICTSAPKKHTPKIIAMMSSGLPPRCLTRKPADNTAPRNAKLVPCRQIMPAPIPNGRRAWMNVPVPETIKAMLIRYGMYWVRPRVEPMIRGGVMIPTKLARTCWNAAKMAVQGLGRSFRP